MTDSFPNLPLSKAQPDGQRFIDVMMGRVQSERPPLVEYLIDDALRKPIVIDLLGREWVEPQAGDRASVEAYLDNFIAVWQGLGYDFCRFEQSLPFSEGEIVGQDLNMLDGERHWRDMQHGAVTTWKEFESYPWPTVTDSFMENYHYLDQHLPQGMGLMVCHAGGIYEHLAAVMSYEGLCFALHDQPRLVEAVAERIGSAMLEVYQRLIELEHLSAIFPGDDMGFRSATLIPPDALRRYTLPWHKRFAELAHAAGLPYFLHSCGNLAEIYDDLIDDIQIDAKHSYENAILPVTEFQAQYGDRIGVLGGIDIDILGRYSAAEVRAEVRRVIDICHPRGRYAMGSGNSIPSYIPLVNLLTMLDEAQRPV